MEDVTRASLSRYCVYYCTTMLSGLVLILITKGSPIAVFATWILPLRILFLFTNMSMRKYARHIIQPKIDDLLSKASGDTVLEELPGAIKVLRMRRKKLTLVCLFDIMVLVTLGVQLAVNAAYGVFAIALAAVLAWRPIIRP